MVLKSVIVIFKSSSRWDSVSFRATNEKLIEEILRLKVKSVVGSTGVISEVGLNLVSLISMIFVGP